MEGHDIFGTFYNHKCYFMMVLLSHMSLMMASAGPLTRIADPHWHSATATSFDNPSGDGSSGGACGYGTLVDVKPYKARVSAVSPILFKGGEGCGACYKVLCLERSICSKKGVTIIVTDVNPSMSSSANHAHFDLSGAAFSRLALFGRDSALRNHGKIIVAYKRTSCTYPGKNIAFRVKEGSTADWISLLVEFENGDGDVGSMHIRKAKSSEWLEMRHLFGANWFISDGALEGPFSIKLTTSTRRTLYARDVIPKHWIPNATYTSRLNF